MLQDAFAVEAPPQTPLGSL